jgi:hypothetical protein
LCGMSKMRSRSQWKWYATNATSSKMFFKG